MTTQPAATTIRPAITILQWTCPHTCRPGQGTGNAKWGWTPHHRPNPNNPHGRDNQTPALVHVRIQPLIKHACPTSPDLKVPWNEWGRGAVIMKTPQASYDSPICVHSTRLMVLKTPSWHGLSDYNRIRTFDFGWRGRSVLPLLDEGPERRAVFENGQELTLDESGHVAWWGGM